MKKKTLREKLADANAEIADLIAQRTEVAMSHHAEIVRKNAEVARLGAYGEAVNIKLAEVHRVLSSPLPEVKATPAVAGAQQTYPDITSRERLYEYPKNTQGQDTEAGNDHRLT